MATAFTQVRHIVSEMMKFNTSGTLCWRLYKPLNATPRSGTSSPSSALSAAAGMDTTVAGVLVGQPCTVQHTATVVASVQQVFARCAIPVRAAVEVAMAACGGNGMSRAVVHRGGPQTLPSVRGGFDDRTDTAAAALEERISRAVADALMHHTANEAAAMIHATATAAITGSTASQWTAQEVGGWLETCGLQRLRPVLAAHDVDGGILVVLDEAMCVEMGLKRLQSMALCRHRDLLLAASVRASPGAVARQNSHGEPALSTVL